VPLPLPDERGWVGDTFRMVWGAQRAVAEYDRFNDTFHGTVASAVFKYRHGNGKEYTLCRSRYNLETGDRQLATAAKLARKGADTAIPAALAAAGVKWIDLLDQAGDLALEAFRRGAPFLRLDQMQRPAGMPRFALKPYVEYERPTSLIGFGGASKSYAAMAMALSKALGKAIFGYPVGPPCNVEYLDWDAGPWVFWDRAKALCTGHGLDLEAFRARLLYRNPKTTLAAMGPQLRREVQEEDVGFLVADALIGAAGGQLNDMAAIRDAYGTLKSLYRKEPQSGLLLPVPSVVVTHYNKETMKEDQEAGRRISAAGSIFIENESAHVWAITPPHQAAEPDGLGDQRDKYLLVTHHKTNNGAYAKPHAYHLRFEQDPADEDVTLSAAYRRIEPTDVPEFAEKLPMTARIVRALGPGVPLSGVEIAAQMGYPKPLREELDPDEFREAMKAWEGTMGKVRSNLSRLSQRRMLRKFPEGRYALASDRADRGGPA
jgi:hypothetical protein